MKPRNIASRAVIFLVPLAFEEATAADLVPVNLRCEYRVDPQGIDVSRPRLSWSLESTARGQAQSAYQLLVAATEEVLESDRGDLWDTGKVPSPHSIHIEYAGKPPASHQVCWWKVRVWDRDGRASGWSQQACWSMGLLDPRDWKARWIMGQRWR